MKWKLRPIDFGPHVSFDHGEKGDNPALRIVYAFAQEIKKILEVHLFETSEVIYK